MSAVVGNGDTGGGPSRRGYLSLGSNLGDRRANLQAAADRLGGHGVAVTASSSVYDTEPVGEVLDQPEFLNACLQVRTELDPEQLLSACKSIERELGRVTTVRHGPRVIDVDVLALGELEHRSQRLTVPHAELINRRFVLVPLLELDPALALPDGTALARALERIGGRQDVRLSGPPLLVDEASPRRSGAGWAQPARPAP